MTPDLTCPRCGAALHELSRVSLPTPGYPTGPASVSVDCACDCGITLTVLIPPTVEDYFPELAGRKTA